MGSKNSAAAVAAPAEDACKNCENPLSGHFCSKCGQKHKHLDPTLHDLVHEVVHEFVHLDGKILVTLKALVLSPGRLSAEFLAGRRARFIAPVRLYLTLSVLFFLLAGHGSDGVVVHGGTPQREAAHAGINPAVDLGVQSQKKDAEGENGWIFTLVSKAQKDPEVFRHAFLSNVSRVIFAIVPLFALGLRLAYWNRHRRYPAFVYFSLHYHAFVFLALTVHALAKFTHVSALVSAAGYTAAASIPIYLLIALRRVFGGSRLNTALRMGALAAFYLPCFVLGITVAVLITVFTL